MWDSIFSIWLSILYIFLFPSTVDVLNKNINIYQSTVDIFTLELITCEFTGIEILTAFLLLRANAGGSWKCDTPMPALKCFPEDNLYIDKFRPSCCLKMLGRHASIYF